MSGVQRILDALADGEWRTSHDLYWQCGPLILHSRIADARKQGHDIEGRHVPGQVGAWGYEYRLRTGGAVGGSPPDDGVNPSCSEPALPSPVSPSAAGQLTLA